VPPVSPAVQGDGHRPCAERGRGGLLGARAGHCGRATCRVRAGAAACPPEGWLVASGHDAAVDSPAWCPCCPFHRMSDEIATVHRLGIVINTR